MARLIKDFDKEARNKFTRHINDDNVKQAAFQEWSSIDRHFIIESDNWALPCWLSGRPSEPFLAVSDGEWSEYRDWSNIRKKYFERRKGAFYLVSGKNYDIAAPIGKIRSLCRVELPFHQYHPEFAFIMKLPGLREEIRKLGLDIGLSFIPDAVLSPDREFINKHYRNRGDFSLERYLSSSSKLLPGYAARFNSVAQNCLLGHISSRDYIFRNEYVERMQYLAMAKNLYSATIEQAGEIRVIVFFAINSMKQLQYVNRCYHKDVKEYPKLMLNLCILAAIEFCCQHKYACNISQTVNFMNIDSNFGYGYGSRLWEFNAVYYPAICSDMNLPGKLSKSAY